MEKLVAEMKRTESSRRKSWIADALAASSPLGLEIGIRQCEKQALNLMKSEHFISRRSDTLPVA